MNEPIACVFCGTRVDVDEAGALKWRPADGEPDLQTSLPVEVGEPCCDGPGVVPFYFRSSVAGPLKVNYGAPVT